MAITKSAAKKWRESYEANLFSNILHVADGAGRGGVIRLHLGDHFRIGSEGYVSTLSQRSNGSYLKFGWGGLLADFYTVIGRLQPYAGLTVGGGAMTTLLMFEEPASVWAPIDRTVFHKQGFMAIDPFVGFLFYH